MLTTATSTQKKAMLKLLSESIAADELNLGVVAVYSSESVNSTAAVNGEVSAVTHLPPPPPPNRDPAYLKTLAEHVEDIGIHETLSDSIISEFHSLNLTGDRLKTQWLSPTRESYNYAAVVNHPKQIKEFPAKDGFSLFHLGGCGQIMGGGCNLFPDNMLAWRRFAPPHSLDFFPDIGLLARNNFAHTIQDLL